VFQHRVHRGDAPAMTGLGRWGSRRHMAQLAKSPRILQDSLAQQSPAQRQPPHAASKTVASPAPPPAVPGKEATSSATSSMQRPLKAAPAAGKGPGTRKAPFHGQEGLERSTANLPSAAPPAVRLQDRLQEGPPAMQDGLTWEQFHTRLRAGLR